MKRQPTSQEHISTASKTKVEDIKLHAVYN